MLCSGDEDEAEDEAEEDVSRRSNGFEVVQLEVSVAVACIWTARGSCCAERQKRSENLNFRQQDRGIVRCVEIESKKTQEKRPAAP